MKPYGLRPGDGEKTHRNTGLNKFSKLKDEGGPKGKNKQSKIHRERNLVHRQARSDEKKEIRNWPDDRDDFYWREDEGG